VDNIYYTYAYLREDGTPYYIGKGCGNRCYDDWGRCVRTPKDRSRVIKLKWDLSEEEAYRHEIYMIAVLGKKVDGGLLHNILDGGSAPPRHCGENHYRFGKEVDGEVKEKISSKLSSTWEITFKSGDVVRVKNLAEWCRQNPHYRNQNVYSLAKDGSPLKTYKDIQSVRKVRQGSSPITKKKPPSISVEVITPSGKVGVYPSIEFAAMALGVHRATINRWRKNANYNELLCYLLKEELTSQAV